MQPKYRIAVRKKQRDLLQISLGQIIDPGPVMRLYSIPWQYNTPLSHAAKFMDITNVCIAFSAFSAFSGLILSASAAYRYRYRYTDTFAHLSAKRLPVD